MIFNYSILNLLLDGTSYCELFFFLSTGKRAKSNWSGVLTEMVVEVAQSNSS